MTLFEEHPGPWTYAEDSEMPGVFDVEDAEGNYVTCTFDLEQAKLFASLPHLFAIVKGFWEDQKENGDPDDEFLASVRNLMESLES